MDKGKGTPQKIDFSKQYDLTREEIRAVEDRSRLRLQLRKEFIKQFTNPHNHGTGEFIFDPALQRWMSMKSSQWYYFKPSVANILTPILVVGIALGYGHFIRLDREKKEKQFRSGLVAYRDRSFKLI